MKKTIEISNRLAEMMRTDEEHLANTLERFAYLLRAATKQNESTFCVPEWALMAHATEASRFDPRLGPIETLAGSVEQEARLEELDAFYEVDLDSLLKKLRDLDTVQAWAVVEALTIAQLPHVNRGADQWWTVLGRKALLARASAGRRRPKPAAKTAGQATVTYPHQALEAASFNGSERDEGDGQCVTEE